MEIIKWWHQSLNAQREFSFEKGRYINWKFRLCECIEMNCV